MTHKIIGKHTDPNEYARRKSAVDAGRAAGKDLKEIASELGLYLSTLRDWVQLEDRRDVILSGIAEGLTYKQIGEKLEISDHRVKQIINAHIPEAKALRDRRKQSKPSNKERS